MQEQSSAKLPNDSLHFMVSIPLCSGQAIIISIASIKGIFPTMARMSVCNTTTQLKRAKLKVESHHTRDFPLFAFHSIPSIPCLAFQAVEQGAVLHISL